MNRFLITLSALMSITLCMAQKHTKKWATELEQPKVFTINGYVDENITDSCYNIYLSDDYFHINDTVPIACVPVVNKRFTYSVPLTKMKAGRIRCIFPGGELCSAWIDLMCVPGETYTLTVHNGYYTQGRNYSYESKMQRAASDARRSTAWDSPNLPKVKGKKWDSPKQQLSYNSGNKFVKDVYFGKEQTVVRIAASKLPLNTILDSTTCLKDDKDRTYRFMRSLMGETSENIGMEAKVYGGFYAYEPMPKDVKSFSIYASDGTRLIENVTQASKKQKPNCTINVRATEGIGDSGYLISVLKDWSFTDEFTADFSLGEDHRGTYKIHVDKPRLASLIATFPDGAVCTHYVPVILIPGCEVNVKVMNGEYELYGDKGFYADYARTEELVENAKKYYKQEETDSIIRTYIEKHAYEPGSLACYVMQRVLPVDELMRYFPEYPKKEDADIFALLKEMAARQHRF